MTRPSPRWNASTKLVVMLTTIVILGWILYRFQVLIPPLVIAMIVAYLLNPLVGALSGRLRISRGLAILLLYLAILLAFSGVSTAVGLAVRQQLIGLVNNLRRVLVELPARLQDDLLNQTYAVGPFTVDLSRIDIAPLLDQALSTVRPALSQTGALIATVTSTVASTLGWVIFIAVLVFYMLKDIHTFQPALERLAEAPGYAEDVRRLVWELGWIWNGFLRGQTVLAIVIGVLVTICMTALGVRYALVLGLLAGLTEFVPIIGPLVSGLIGTLVALFQVSNWLGLPPVGYAALVAGVYFVIQQIENNFLVPRILGHSLNLHPMAVLIAALMGATLAGILGLLLAAPTFATLRLLARYAWSKLLDLDPFPEPLAEPERKPLFAFTVPEWVRRRLRLRPKP